MCIYFPMAVPRRIGIIHYADSYVSCPTVSRPFANTYLSGGHSFLPNDRDFVIVKRNLGAYDRIYNLREYVQAIVNAPRDSRKFVVHLVQRSDILQFKTWWQNYYRRKVQATECRKRRGEEKVPTILFDISKFYDFLYSVDSVHARRTIYEQQSTFHLSKKKNVCPLLPTKSVKILRHLQETQLDSMKKLLKYVPNTPQNQRFWRKIYPNFPL